MTLIMLASNHFLRQYKMAETIAPTPITGTHVPIAICSAKSRGAINKGKINKGWQHELAAAGTNQTNKRPSDLAGGRKNWEEDHLRLTVRARRGAAFLRREV